MRRKEGRGGGWESYSEGRSGWKTKKVEGGGSFCFPDLLLVANHEMAMMPMRGEGGCYEVPPQLGYDKGQNAADDGPSMEGALRGCSASKLHNERQPLLEPAGQSPRS